MKVQAAAEKAGVTLTISSAFRTMKEQQYFYNLLLADDGQDHGRKILRAVVSHDVMYQCHAGSWYRNVIDGVGRYGACTSIHSP